MVLDKLKQHGRMNRIIKKKQRIHSKRSYQWLEITFTVSSMINFVLIDYLNLHQHAVPNNLFLVIIARDHFAYKVVSQ